jgi:hypothetical protein
VSTTLYLTVPCEVVGKKDAPRPIYMGKRGYLCPFCGAPYAGYLPCSKHMGMFSYNGNTTCKVLQAGEGRFIKPPCSFCVPEKVFPNFSALAGHVQRKHMKEAKLITLAAKRNITEEEKDEMGKSIADVKKERGIGGPPMLKGSDVPKNVTKFKIKIGDLREAPAVFKSPFIIDLADAVYGKEAFAVNITNLRALAEMAGLDPETADCDAIAKKMKGKTVQVYISMTNNPQSKKMVRSLFFSTT